MLLQFLNFLLLDEAFQLHQDWFATNCFQWKLPRRPIFDLICCRRGLILQFVAGAISFCKVQGPAKTLRFPFPLFRIDSRRQPPMENLSKLVKRQGTGRRPRRGSQQTFFGGNSLVAIVSQFHIYTKNVLVILLKKQLWNQLNLVDSTDWYRRDWNIALDIDKIAWLQGVHWFWLIGLDSF